MSDLAPIAVLDPDVEMRRHAQWRRVAQLRAELLLNPTVEVHLALAEALVQLREGGSR
jgi:hypothetical protein